MHGASRVSSAVSVCHIYQTFATISPSGEVARLVRRWTINIIRRELSPLVDCAGIYQIICLGYELYFSFMLGIVDF